MILDNLPRLGLLAGATPLHRWWRLSELTGREVWAKRDDLTPLLLGGNKTRKLDVLIGDALAAGADCVVTYGARQSNHCALTAAAARRAGLEVTLCLRGSGVEPAEGNVLLDSMLEARLLWDRGPHDAPARAAWLDAVAADLRAAGRRPYVIPYGGSGPLGVAAYALAGRELQQQVDAAGVAPEFVAVTSSSGGTQAGLVLAGALGWLRVPVLGVSVDLPAPALAGLVHRLAGEAADRWSLPPPGLDLVAVDDSVRGGAYGEPSPQGREAARRLLLAEGVLTDATYTAKGLAGFLAAADRLEPGHAAVFWHTGGLPAVFVPPPAAVTQSPAATVATASQAAARGVPG